MQVGNLSPPTFCLVNVVPNPFAKNMFVRMFLDFATEAPQRGLWESPIMLEAQVEWGRTVRLYTQGSLIYPGSPMGLECLPTT